MNHPLQNARLIIIALLAMAINAHALGDITTITLKSTVRVSGDKPVQLGQISSIIGDQTELLVGLVVEELFSGERGNWQKVSTEDLRALIEGEPAINGGSVVIEGGGVSVRRLDSPLVQEQRTAAKVELESSEPSGPVLRGNIERWVRDRYKIGSDLVRMTFRSQDEGFIAQETEGRLVEIREISKRGRTAIRVVLFEGFEIVDERAVVFEVEIFRAVLVAGERINRGTILDDSHFMAERRWVSPEEQAAGAHEAIGMAISKTINPGQLLQRQHIELPLVIRRGDIVSAKSIAGSVVVTVRGRAKSSARKGEIVEIESMNGETSFNARAISKGRALIIQDSELNGA